MVCGGGAGEHEDSGADDGPNAEEGELPWPKGFDEAGFVFGLMLEVIDLFGSKESSERGTWSLKSLELDRKGWQSFREKECR